MKKALKKQEKQKVEGGESRRSFLKKAAVAAGVAGAAKMGFPLVAKGATEVIRWRGQNQGPTNVQPYGPFKLGQTGTYSSTKVFTDWIYQRTGGRLVLEWAEPGSVYPQADTDINMQQGTLPISTIYPTYYSGRVPEADIETGAVFMWEANSQFWECLWKYGLLEGLRETYAKKNIFWLPQPVDAIVGIGTNFPCPDIASLKGKKIRTTGIWSDYARLCGASPVNIAWADIYMATKLGTVDGWIAGSATMEELKLKETTKYFVSYPVISLAGGNILINMDAYKKLPKDIQDILRDEAPAFLCGVPSTGWHNQCLWVLHNAVKEYGLTVYQWSAKDVAWITQQVVDVIYPKMSAKSANMAKLMDMVLKQMRDYGRIK